ncbi:MAG TPA: hypothetical protein VKR52_00115 [Terracidiphilus sp.]|nr:hypothetical protein [Terracidiphilus sp.]
MEREQDEGNGNLVGNMVRFPLPAVLIALILAAIPCFAQDQSSSGRKIKEVPPLVAPAPFSIDGPTQDSVPAIEYRSADQLSAKDRLIVANAESSIAEHAGINGLEMESGNWTYEQVVCPALPNHLFLRYSRNNGKGDVSEFTASIPRNNDGRVRVIPILRRGYSLFSPAPINALTISAFNHIRDEESKKDSASWIGNGLCYAALAGAHPTAISPNEIALEDDPPVAQTATLHVQFQGGEMVEFSDVAAKPHPMEWEMTFTRKGKLIKARHFQAPTIEARHVTDRSPVLQTRQVPQ